MPDKTYPIPDYFSPARIDQVWRVPYQERAEKAREYAREHAILPAAEDSRKTCLILIDVQNTFCIPDFELFVGGKTGRGAVDDSRRLCEFIYRNLGNITQIAPTLDTHTPLQIFHALFLVDENGRHPKPNTMVSLEDIREGRWKFNPPAADSIGIDPRYAQRYLEHYVAALAERKKYDLTIWPYHAILGGIGHALVSAVEEAVFFHSVARYTRADFLIKGDNPLTEHYSAVGPEVIEDHLAQHIGEKSSRFIQKLVEFDRVIIAGQAKSHCVAWTINDLLEDVREKDPRLVEKVYLLEDCTSPVVIPGVVDFSGEADAAFERFSKAGMHIIRSDQDMNTWPG